MVLNPASTFFFLLFCPTKKPPFCFRLICEDRPKLTDNLVFFSLGFFGFFQFRLPKKQPTEADRQFGEKPKNRPNCFSFSVHNSGYTYDSMRLHASSVWRYVALLESQKTTTYTIVYGYPFCSATEGLCTSGACCSVRDASHQGMPTRGPAWRAARSGRENANLPTRGRGLASHDRVRRGGGRR